MDSLNDLFDIDINYIPPVDPRTPSEKLLDYIGPDGQNWTKNTHTIFCECLRDYLETGKLFFFYRPWEWTDSLQCENMCFVAHYALEMLDREPQDNIQWVLHKVEDFIYAS